MPLSVVAKKGKKLRMVLDCRHINEHILCPKFKQEGVDVVADQIQEGDILISVDIKWGFHHLKVRQQDRRFLCFA